MLSKKYLIIYMKNKNIIWLASFPKSGSTWIRVFLSNLVNNHANPTDINNLPFVKWIASSHKLFETATGINPQDLYLDEVDSMRPAVYKYHAAQEENNLYIKVHDAYTYLPSGSPLFPTEVSHGVIYILRNPLDVTVSFAAHLGWSIERTVVAMQNNSDFCGATDKCYGQLRQQLLQWHTHLKSWVNNKNMPVQVIRYEDMHQNPIETFKKVVDFIGLQTDMQTLRNAIEASSFNKLQWQETQQGFLENKNSQQSFFRSGTIGNWRKHLNNKQEQTIIDLFNNEMKMYGYLNDNNGLLV